MPLILFILTLLLSGQNILKGDDDDDDERKEGHQSQSKLGDVQKLNSRTDFKAVSNPKWKAECSSCHMLYLPGLLPSKSWKKMMTSLNKHFGENAELDPAVQKEITDFLIQNSSDIIHTRRGDKILSGIGSNSEILRISETPYFIRKHDEIGANVYKRKSIGSAANCIACHKGAEIGDFREQNISIPKETPKETKTMIK